MNNVREVPRQDDKMPGVFVGGLNGLQAPSGRWSLTLAAAGWTPKADGPLWKDFFLFSVLTFYSFIYFLFF